MAQEAGIPESHSQGKEEKKKKKHKDKPATMSLDQFNQMNSEKPKVFSEGLKFFVLGTFLNINMEQMKF